MMLRENLLRRFSRLPRAAKPPSHKIAPVANEKRSLEATFITIVLRLDHMLRLIVGTHVLLFPRPTTTDVVGAQADKPGFKL